MSWSSGFKQHLVRSSLVHPSGAKRYFVIASWLLIAQAVLMELVAALVLPILLVVGLDQADVGEHFRFALPYLQENLYLMMVMSGIFGALRLTGAVALLRDRVWGLVLSLVMCTVTLALMIFLLPAGIADGVLSGAALVLILIGWFGSARVSDNVTSPVAQER
jgi:Mg2+/citrate symporter